VQNKANRRDFMNTISITTASTRLNPAVRTPGVFVLQYVNPLRDLDMPRLVALIENGNLGFYALLQWLYYHVEKTNPTVRAVKKRLNAALGSLKWDVKIVDTGEDEQKKQLAEKQQKDLRTNYDAVTNLRAALNFLALAELRGFSHLEKVYAGAAMPEDELGELDPWTVTELRIVEQWFWAKNGFYGDWLYNPSAIETNTGEPIELDNYVIHTVDDPADEIFARLAVKQQVNDSDWDGFLEDYGIPPQFFALPPNVPKEREAEFQRMSELAISAARGSVPHGTELLTPTATGSGGTGVFKERLEYLDGQIVIAGTSGKLTILSEGGSGTLAGSAQKEAFDEIAEAIAQQVSSVMQAQFDKPLLHRLYPGEPALAYFEFAPVDKEDAKAVLTDAASAADAGYKMDEEELSEKSGYKLTYVGLPGAQTPPDTENKKEEPPPAAGAGRSSPGAGAAAAPGSTAASPAAPGDAVGNVAQALQVAPAFVAPGKAIIDDLIAKASDNSISVEELTTAAENLLKTVPELDATADLDSVIDALTAAVQRAAEATLAGA
jgi:hypothetical protein